MLENKFVRKTLVGLALVASGGLGVVNCLGGDDDGDCEAQYEQRLKQLAPGGYIASKLSLRDQYDTTKVDNKATYGKVKLGLAKDDGCPSGCTSISDTCCECN